ncbi:Protein CBG05852 [Caenorhabditis briggsae]|uniref:Protein CBG05852 n=2 Tax=Caenorhabditis briggsae TaxID=6238 RepID=A8X1H2_CAEBR|nr:Protein CBG05852 [Caenorhabditis briggsae]CAP26482.1 Protein CBG05852 [Caenorhabditis briggsae]
MSLLNCYGLPEVLQRGDTPNEQRSKILPSTPRKTSPPSGAIVTASGDEKRKDSQPLFAVMASFLDFLQVNKHKTFRPRKKFPQGTLRYSLHKQAEATLHSGVDLRHAVKLPPSENFDDWLAVHTVDFFNRINLMYGTISDVCTCESCPTMCGGSRYEYLWQDGLEYKKPTRLPAPQYMQLLMDWIEVRINDESIFPSSTNVSFPKDFRQICKKILTRLFRVFVHVYIHHFDRIRELGAEPHANTLYKHFYFFVTEYGMVSAKELEALKDMTERLLEPSNRRAPIPSANAFRQ